MKARAEWHRDFFRNSFYNPASPAAVAKAPAEAAFILRKFGLARGAALLDLCCGPGRHAVEFARRGLAVTGFDFSREYLREAAARAKKKKAAVRLVRGDMRRLPFRGEFDAAVNLFTSFGYFRKLSDDIRTLKGVARALKPGGFFLIDIINGSYVRKNFRPRSWYEQHDHYVLEEVEVDDDGAHSTWLRLPLRGGRPVSRTFFSRLYDRHRLSAALETAGLKPLRFWGNFAGEPLSPRRNRLICLARKA